MSNILTIIAVLFWILTLIYTVFLLSGVYFRSKYIKYKTLDYYPSVSILIPAYNEAKVLPNTLYAMSKLKYNGKLDIFLLDDSSKDNTEEIVKFYEKLDNRIHYIQVPNGYPKGKSRVLNYGTTLSDSEYICVYDADNQPEDDALTKLVIAAENEPNSCGAVGYVKTINFYKNLLTRMIAIEFSVFLLIMQCGRWNLFKLGTYTGTNMIVKRKALEDVSFWDVNAIAEDSDLSMSLTAKGYVCPVVPDSVTWEQEPQTLRTWFKQRVRWMKGNLYIIGKTIRTKEWHKGRVLFNSIQMLSVYIVFVSLLLMSHTFFVCGMFFEQNIAQISLPLTYLWYFSWLFYFVLVISALFVDKYVSVKNIFTAFIMYLTYSQMWIVLLVKSLFDMMFGKKDKKKGVVWDKTVRF